jgi:hypothetical protein
MNYDVCPAPCGWEMFTVKSISVREAGADVTKMCNKCGRERTVMHTHEQARVGNFHVPAFASARTTVISYD